MKDEEELYYIGEYQIGNSLVRPPKSSKSFVCLSTFRFHPISDHSIQ